MSVRASLCPACVNVRVIRNARGSTFYQCLAGDKPVYPPQPVTVCGTFAAGPRRADS